MPTPAREAAFDILIRVEQKDAYASELLHGGRLDKLSTEDRNLATEIVMGTLRWQARLDLGIASVSKQPLNKLDKEVLTAMRMGAYQIGWMRLPARAAVNESVELIKRARFKYSAPYVNAVLRKLAANPALMKPMLKSGSKTEEDIAALYSHPLWMVERWVSTYGSDVAEKVCGFDQQVPATAVRVNELAVAGELMAAGIELAPGAVLKSARRVIAGDVTGTRVFSEGRVAIQDEASQLVALLVGHGERLLDCCAAPGGKTAILAARNPHSHVVAAELHPQRASRLQARMNSLANVRVITSDVAAVAERDFDRVLADVPCSGTGTLARNPEIKWKLQPADLADLHGRQVAILNAALDRVRAGGRVVYSSCSLEPEENEEVVRELLQARSDIQLLDGGQLLREIEDLAIPHESLTKDRFLRTIPGIHPCDGFFAAVLQRLET